MPRFSRSFPQSFPQLARTARMIWLISLISLSTTVFGQILKQQFLNPPNAGKPLVRWWWFGAAVEKPEILHELQQMKADGIGGAELAFVYPEVLDDPAKGLKNLPFLSPGMLDAVRFAQAEGRKLGLRIDVTLCSGWPYGGPATTLAEAAGSLRTVEVPIAAHALVAIPPALDAGDSIISAAIVDLLPISTSEHCGFAYGNVCGGPITTAARLTTCLVWLATKNRAMRGLSEGVMLPPVAGMAWAEDGFHVIWDVRFCATVVIGPPHTFP